MSRTYFEAELRYACSQRCYFCAMNHVLARQAGNVRQEPPMYLRSTTAVRCPTLAIVQARYLPASPLPMKRTL